MLIPFSALEGTPTGSWIHFFIHIVIALNVIKISIPPERMCHLNILCGTGILLATSGSEGLPTQRTT
jgi:hypothetical protein